MLYNNAKLISYPFFLCVEQRPRLWVRDQERVGRRLPSVTVAQKSIFSDIGQLIGGRCPLWAIYPKAQNKKKPTENTKKNRENEEAGAL